MPSSLSPAQFWTLFCLLWAQWGVSVSIRWALTIPTSRKKLVCATTFSFPGACVNLPPSVSQVHTTHMLVVGLAAKGQLTTILVPSLFFLITLPVSPGRQTVRMKSMFFLSFHTKHSTLPKSWDLCWPLYIDRLQCCWILPATGTGSATVVCLVAKKLLN